MSMTWIACLAAVAAAAVGTAEPVEPPVAPPTASSMAAVRVVLAGDSTVTDRSGWGLGFAERFDKSQVAVVNVSQGGRSSKSFRDEGFWQKVLDARPTHVLIQFGHNDQPGKGPERETDPKTTFRENLSRYVAEARAIGARPVLITSIERRRFQPDGKIKASLAEYAEATRAVAAKESVPLLDLNARTIALYEQLGAEAWKPLSPTDKDGKLDSTHLNQASGRLVGDIVVEELIKAVPEIATFVVARPTTQSSK
jgi:lysophospholipase L1-like esterase